MPASDAPTSVSSASLGFINHHTPSLSLTTLLKSIPYILMLLYLLVSKFGNFIQWFCLLAVLLWIYFPTFATEAFVPLEIVLESAEAEYSIAGTQEEIRLGVVGSILKGGTTFITGIAVDYVKGFDVKQHIILACFGAVVGTLVLNNVLLRVLTFFV